MKPEITNDNKPFTIDVKRFYFNTTVEAKCPECERLCKIDYRHDYLSYPEANEPMDIQLHCELEHEFYVTVVLKVALELVLHANSIEKHY